MGKPLRYAASCLLGLFLGVIIGAFAFVRSDSNSSAFVEEVDNNADSIADSKFYYDSGFIIKTEYDRNFDQKWDLVESFKDGAITTAETDDDFDGKMDGWLEYEHGNVLIAKYDYDKNGVPDVSSHFKFGVLNLSVWRPNNQKTITRLELFVDGQKSRTYVDSDGNDLFDTLLQFDEMENLRSTEKLSSEMPPKSILENRLRR